MKEHKGAHEFKSDHHTVVTIGTFDGVHVGHQKIIERLVNAAKANHLESAILTFFPHPRMVLQKDSDIKLINTIEERKEILRASGVDHLIIHPFTQQFSRLSAEEFVREILVNKLKAKRVVNPPDMWVRQDAAFEPIVDRDFFEAAQRIIRERSKRFSDKELLDRLSALLAEKGALSGLIIDELDDMPSSSTFRHRFGSLVRAYELVGYTPARDYRYIDTNRALRALHPDVVEQVVWDIQRQGGAVRRDPLSDLLHVNEEFSASLVIARCHVTLAGSLRWKIRFDQGLRPDITIAVRMDDCNAAIRDYYLLPWLEAGAASSLRLAPENGILLDAYRFDTLDAFVDLARRVALRVAA